MRIFHVADIYIRSGGGMPNVIRAIGMEQIVHGHEVHVLTFQYDDAWPLQETIDGIHVHRTPIKQTLLPYYISGYNNMRTLATDVSQRFSPDIIHVHMPFSGSAVVSAIPHVPVCYTFHGSWAEEYEVEASGIKRSLGVYKLESKLMRWYEKKILRHASTITALSCFMLERAQVYDVSPRQGWHIIPSGVDLDRFRVMSSLERELFRQRKHVPKDAFLLFTARRLAKRMGLENLLAAMKQIKQQIPEVFLIIGGKGELSNQLQTLIISSQLQEITRLEGFISEEELPFYFGAADLAILPTIALEGFGLTILESMATGTPIIGTPVGSIPEVLSNFDPNMVSSSVDPASIAQRVITLHHMQKEQGASSMRNAARRYAQSFAWSKIASEYERIYQTVL